MNVEFKIEKGVPIPSPRRKNDGITYMFRCMEIGDSFYSESETASFHVLAKRAGVKICVRTEGLGKRVWRIQ